jgi:hypothetical protein
MTKRLSLLALPIVIAVLLGCGALMGEEVARLSINQVSTDENQPIVKEVSLDLKKDDEIMIWSDMDIEYEGNVEFRFIITILKDGEHFGEFEIDPTDKNITVGEMKTCIMEKTEWRFSGKNTELLIEENAHYTFKGMLVASENPTLKVTKAEVILKK